MVLLSKVIPLCRLRTLVNGANSIRSQSGGSSPIGDKIKKHNLRNGEPVKPWEVVALFGAIGLLLWEHGFCRLWEWEVDGTIGAMLYGNLGKYYYRKPIADQIAEQKRKDYEAGIDWKIKIFQE